MSDKDKPGFGTNSVEPLYTCHNVEGPDFAVNGKWEVKGPNIETLHFTDRLIAQVVRRALNLAYTAGQERMGLPKP